MAGPVRTSVRERERGAALLIALALAVALSLLSLTVMASRDLAVLVVGGTSRVDRAHRAAASGLEWAAASVRDRGFVAATGKLDLGRGTTVAVTIDPSKTPHATAVARCDGVEVTQVADLRKIAGASLPYAYASFAGTNRYDDTVVVKGSAWFEEPSMPITSSGAGELEMHGDLYLRTSTPPVAGKVIHVSGATYKSQPAVGAPTVDVSPFESMSSGAVPVVHYTGGTTIRGVTLTGIVDVALGLTEKLTIQNATIAGTLVVRRTGLLSSLTYPQVDLRDDVTIAGGTAITGNLAVLAPLCQLTGSRIAAAKIEGVTVVREVKDLRYATFVGQFVVLGATLGTNNTYTIERPDGFLVDTPLGITWPGPASVRIDWLGQR
ncbi:MAG: hypothetical protein WAT39_12360 [Planctomycetota bacterium]